MTPDNAKWVLEGWSAERMRAIAFSYIPHDATLAEARGWLVSSRLKLSSEIVSAICHIHLEDEILKSWRVDSILEFDSVSVLLNPFSGEVNTTLQNELGRNGSS